MPLNKKDQYIAELEALAKGQYKDMIELKKTHIENKNKYRNLTRCLNTLKMEEVQDHLETRASETTTLRLAEIEQEERLAQEMDRIKRDEINEKKLRQHLRANNQELKSLERKLRAGYVMKEQMAQIAEKKAMKMEEKIKDRAIHEVMQSAWIDYKEYRDICVKEDIDKKANYRQELHDQMICEEQNRRYEYEEFLREKKMLDDIIQRMNDEDVRALEERMCRMRKTQQEIDTFKAAQNVWKEKQKRELAEENRKIQEILMSTSSEAKLRKEAKEKKDAAKVQIGENIAKQMYALQKQRRDREEITALLVEEEKREERENKDRAETEKQMRSRVDLLTGLTRQMQEHREQAHKQAEEDALYKEQLIKKIAEDERVEQMKTDKKRMKMLQIRRDVERMIVERRQKKAEDLQLQMRILEEEQKAADETKRLVKEERIKMLKQHTTNLIGYLPKGILELDDLPHLSSEVLDTYTKK